MNIQEAKEQIEKAVRIYLKKDEYGNYRIPVERQRPVFVLGPPGIGKTAIMEQIAEEMGIALVSYSMTHHTRQSALGLPFISHKKYQNAEFDVSEYTMSEIIASVYEMMETSGKKEGILFLDEINCVSETLAPSMLQFLQFKTFGKHRVPEGWVVATAGNPPQFNRSVREFDVVTLDRLKVLEVEADYDTWRKYAVSRGLHGSVITYLDIKKSDFYVIENTVDGKSYVTARGWEDLSEIIYLYEENGFPVEETLISQYLRNARISREFAAYYDLYQKYKQDYRVEDILAGQADEEIRWRVKQAGFDERLSLIGLLLAAIQREIRENVAQEDALRELLLILKGLRDTLSEMEEPSRENILNTMRANWESLETMIEREDTANSLSVTQKREYQMIIETLKDDARAIRMQDLTHTEEAFALVKRDFEEKVSAMKADQRRIREELSHLFTFVEENLGTENEMLVLVTDLTVSAASAKFLSRVGCPEYEKYNKKFQIYERQQEIDDAVDKLRL